MTRRAVEVKILDGSIGYWWCANTEGYAFYQNVSSISIRAARSHWVKTAKQLGIKKWKFVEG